MTIASQESFTHAVTICRLLQRTDSQSAKVIGTSAAGEYVFRYAFESQLANVKGMPIVRLAAF
ncbi:MAG: hypothetical protein AAGI63_03550 [Planctomycetota bacterium]